MKNLKLTFAIIAMMLFSVSFANSPLKSTMVKSGSQLELEIKDLFKNKMHEFKAADVITEVTFTLNRSNEIVVIDVDSEDSEASSFVENVISNKELSVKEVKRGSIYTLPIRIIVEE